MLQRDDPELFRWLRPCDPVITVADDVVFFECFSADESSYGCLTVSRNAFGPGSDVSLGTTNVDYSWDLYNHFQGMRTYRQTRFLIDPAGFEVHTEAAPEYREEKIDLPPGWLRGFMTTQEAMGMPGLTVSISREAVYSILAFLKRHKAKCSPRAIRFDLLPGQASRNRARTVAAANRIARNNLRRPSYGTDSRMGGTTATRPRATASLGRYALT